MCKIVDKYGVELACGDMVCFVQAGSIIKGKITEFASTKTRDFVVWRENGLSIPTSKVVKCY